MSEGNDQKTGSGKMETGTTQGRNKKKKALLSWVWWCNLSFSYLRGRDQRIAVQGQPEQKVCKTHLKQ
jgi:hypothetical protein